MNTHVALDEKLNALQQADTFRKWYSLDDHRVCVLCEKLITGRMIDVWQDAHGGYRFHCPTPGCAATPRDWFYHGSSRLRAGRLMKSTAAALFRTAAML